MDRTLSHWSLFDMGSLAQSIMLAAQERGVDSAPAVVLAAIDLLRADWVFRVTCPSCWAWLSGTAIPTPIIATAARRLEDVAHFTGF